MKMVMLSVLSIIFQGLKLHTAAISLAIAAALSFMTMKTEANGLITAVC